jgi:hypothetical protein
MTGINRIQLKGDLGDKKRDKHYVDCCNNCNFRDLFSNKIQIRSRGISAYKAKE